MNATTIIILVLLILIVYLAATGRLSNVWKAMIGQ